MASGDQNSPLTRDGWGEDTKRGLPSMSGLHLLPGPFQVHVPVGEGNEDDTADNVAERLV